MTTRARRFVFASLVALALGLAAGILAYIVGLPASRISAQATLPELQLMPGDAAFLGYVNVRAVMASELGQRIRQAGPLRADGQRQFETETGISIERDIDRVVIYAAPTPAADTERPAASLALARGRFDTSRIEALMQQHGAAVQEYKGTRVAVSEGLLGPNATGGGQEAVALAFIEPGLVAIGNAELVRGAIDRGDGQANMTGNDEVMARVRLLDGDAWAIGRVDALGSRGQLPVAIAGKVPPIRWLTLSVRVGGGLDGVLQAEAPDEESANTLRDLVRGFIALGKLQAPAGPGMETLLQSLQLGGTGPTVILSFKAPQEIFESLGSLP